MIACVKIKITRGNTMGNKYHSGFFIISLALVMILLTSSTSAIPNESSIFQTNSLNNKPSMEYARLVPGLDKAVYAELFVFGGEGTPPVNVDASGLKEAYNWMITYTNQADFANYLNRAPAGFPDGLTLLLQYPGSVSTIASFGYAASAAGIFEAKYKVTFDLLYADAFGDSPKVYVFYNNTGGSAVAGDVAGIHDQGFSAIMDAATLTSAPVRWAGYGVTSFDSDKVIAYGMGWVDADGITSTSAGVYTLSTQNVFGSSFDAVSTPEVGLSRLTFSIPYPVTVVSNGITPATSNPLPHITNRMQWDMRHPISWYDLPPSNDYSVTFKVGTTYGFPNVQNKLTIDQAKLNEEGILEALFELENIGDKTAKDISISFPVGPDFEELSQKNLTIWTIKDDLVIDIDHTADYTVKLVDPLGLLPSINHKAFTLTGWYDDTTTGDPVLWDTRTTYNLMSLTGGISLDIDSTGANAGFPVAFINALDTYIKNDLASLTSTSILSFDLKTFVKTHLEDVLIAMFNETLLAMYDEVDKFIFHEGDFTLVERDVAINAAETQLEWFLEAFVDELTPAGTAGATTSLTFSITDIPTTADRLALPYFKYQSAEQTGTYPFAEMISKEQNYYQLIQYFFQIEEFDGRPISFRPSDDSSSTNPNYFSDVYRSDGARFTWKNDEGFPFFGLSNGQNLQIADDEAVVSAVLTLDKQVYVVGETMNIEVALKNVGDAPAENMKVHLFHASLGRDWRFERVEEFAVIDVGTLAAGASKTVSYADEANSFLGYSPVYAVVEFDSAEEDAPEIPDFFAMQDRGTVVFEAGGDTHHFVMSTLNGALLKSASDVQAPAIPEARLTVTSSIAPSSGLTIDDTFTYTITIKNDGDASTNVVVKQTFDDEDFTRDGASTASEGTVMDGDNYVLVYGITLDPNDSATITIKLKINVASAMLPPAVVDYTITGESSLGASVNTGTDISVSTGSNSLLALSAGAAAQQQAEKSATADSSAAAYSASSSVGASVQVIQNTDEQTVSDGPGFVGLSPSEALGLILVPLAFISLIKRKRY